MTERRFRARRRRPASRRLGVFVGLAVLLPAVLGSAASADPISDKKAEAARLAKELDGDGNQVSVAAESLNRARLKLDGLHSSMEAAKADLGRANARMGSVRKLLAVAAVQAYVTGGSASLFAHLAHSDNGDLVLRRQYLSFTAADQRDILGQLKAAREDYSAVQARLAGDEHAAAAANAQADAAWRKAADAAGAQQALLGKVKGELVDLVSAEQARLEAAAASKAAEVAKAAADRPAPLKATPAPAPGPAPKVAAKAPVVAQGPPPPTSRGAAAAVAEAQRQVGKPYVYGGAGPNSFDCSGLMMWAWRAGGVSLSHSALTQWYETTRVPTNALQPGDILFYGSSVQGIHHDAMYVGNGQMIEAPHTGLNVRYANPFRPDLLGAGRPG